MADWFSQLKSGLLSGGSLQAHLAAFGKHPGWDDHLDDFGLNTESLLAAKQYLYVLGIGSALDSGVWDRGDQADFVPGFKHLFVWTGGNDIVIGRMWSSSDGKSRTRYPMVVCVHFQNASFEAVIERAARLLNQIEIECKNTTSAAAVTALLKKCSEEIQQLPGNPPQPAPVENGAFAANIQQTYGTEALPRLAYAFDTYLQSFAPGKVNRKELGLNLRLDQARVHPQHLRLPGSATDVLGAFRYWHRLLATRLDPAAPVFMIGPIDANWIDLIAGPLTAAQMECIRMTPKISPLSSDVPFSLDKRAVARAAELFQTPITPAETGTRLP